MTTPSEFVTESAFVAAVAAKHGVPTGQAIDHISWAANTTGANGVCPTHPSGECLNCDFAPVWHEDDVAEIMAMPFDDEV